MSFSVDYEAHPGYLQATVTGFNSAGTVAKYLDDIRRECEQRDCYRVLIVEELTGPRLSVDDVFSVASDGASRALGIFQAIAYVDESMGDMAYFAENVAINRGIPVKVFSRVEDAREWLSGMDEDASDEQEIFRG